MVQGAGVVSGLWVAARASDRSAATALAAPAIIRTPGLLMPASKKFAFGTDSIHPLFPGQIVYVNNSRMVIVSVAESIVSWAGVQDPTRWS